MTGLAVTMLQEIAGVLNLTFSLEAATAHSITSGSWGGVARKMKAHRRDLIINGLPLAWDLAHALDTSVPVLRTSYGIGLKTSVPLKRWERIMYPFRGWVWVGLGCTLIPLALVFHVIVKNTGRTVYTHRADVLSTVLWLSRTLVNQSVAQIPNVPGSRILLYFWWMTALVITASYMGNLIAFLTVAVQPTTAKTLKETMKFDFPVYARRQDSLIADLLTASQDPVYQELRERLIFYDHFPDIYSVLKESKGMFLASTSYLEYQIMGWGDHDLHILEEKIFPTYSVWAFQKGTVWRYQFDKYLNMMADTGLLDKWQRDFLTTFRVAKRYFKEKTDKRKIILRPLNLHDLEGAFIIFIFGYLFSLLVLALENRHSLKHYLKKAKENVFWALWRLKTNIIANIQRRRRLCRKNNNRKRGKSDKPREFFEEKLHEDIEALRKILQMHQPKGGIGGTNTRDQERALLLSRQSTSTSLIVPQERNAEAELVQCSSVVEIE